MTESDAGRWGLEVVVKLWGLALAVSVLPGRVAAGGDEVRYPAGSVEAVGYLAVPDGEGPWPGVLVVHEWWGHNAYARLRADQLAAVGYAALAVDMYGDGKTADHPGDAQAFAGAVRSDMGEARKRFEGALEFLHSRPGVDRGKTAAIGYCFGGSVVLQMALAGVEGLDGVASFHGSLGGLEFPESGPVAAALLVCHGAADPFISDEQVAAFKGGCERVAARLEFESYEGASHSFTNPEADAMAEKFSMPIGYDEAADRASWAALEGFLKRVFGSAAAAAGGDGEPGGKREGEGGRTR